MAEPGERLFTIPDKIPVNAKYPAADVQDSAHFWTTYIAAVDQCIEEVALHGFTVSVLDDMRKYMMVWIEDAQAVTDRDTLCEMCGVEKFMKSYVWTQLDLLKRILIVVSECVASGCELPRGWNYWFVQQYLEDVEDSQGDTRNGTLKEDIIFDHAMAPHQVYIPSVDEL